MAQTEEKRKVVYPPARFWRALLKVHNHYLAEEIDGYLSLPQSARSGHICESLLVLHDWLDIAIEEEWLDDE